MQALIAAAKQEGTLNVIALPPTFANYGVILHTFSKLYGIKINELAPDVGSQQEITQIKRAGATAQAADVLDVQMPVAAANASLFAPYEVATWSSIPAGQKAANGTWVQDYGGYMSVGYDPTRFGKITSLSQLLSHKFASAVALDGDPTQATSALYGVMMANLALGGSPDDISAGVGFFKKLASGRQPGLCPGDDAADDQVGPDSGRHQLGLPEHGAGRRPDLVDLAAFHSLWCGDRQLLRSGGQQERARIRRRPGCGRSTCTHSAPTAGRTSGSRAASGRSSRRR